MPTVEEAAALCVPLAFTSQKTFVELGVRFQRPILKRVGENSTGAQGGNRNIQIKTPVGTLGIRG